MSNSTRFTFPPPLAGEYVQDPYPFLARARETAIAGVPIPKGAHLLLHLGSGGHDSAMFPDGEQCDFRRPNADAHLSFGHGIHFCLGAGLARAESRLVLESLLARFPEMRLVPEQRIDYVPNRFFRGPQRLRASW